MQCEILWEGVRKVPPKTFPRTWYLMCIVAKYLKGSQQYLYRIQIKHKLTLADMEKTFNDEPVVRGQV